MSWTIITSFIFLFHAYYISFTEMEYNASNKSIETTIKLTAHDLEAEMESIYKTHPNFEIQSDSTSKLITAYLNQNLQLSQNEKNLDLILSGYEYDLSGDLFIYLKFVKFNPKKEFKLSNKILFSLFPQQQNIISINVEEKKYHKTLSIKESTFISDKQ